MVDTRSTQPAADLLSFVDASPSPYHCVAEAARRLGRAGFSPSDWTGDFEPSGAGYVEVGGALVAWKAPAGGPGSPVRIIGAHTDSPNLRIKPRPDHTSAGFRQLLVEPYGGLLQNSWLDRDLGLSGRVVVRDATGGTETRLFRDDRPLLRVPQLAIHLDRDVNNGLKLNPAVHLTPVWGLGDDRGVEFRQWLAAQVDARAADVMGWDVMCHDTLPGGFLGDDEELISAPRLDNQASCFGAVETLVRLQQEDTTRSHGVIVALFDHEEVGSQSSTGAGGALLGHVISRLNAAWGGTDADLVATLASSHCLSADMAHGTHPNYPERHDVGAPIRLGGGPVVKANVNQRYATDGPSAADFRLAAERAGVATQTYSHRNDLTCGSTIGPMTAAGLGVATVDVGMAMLSMHSIRELMATADVAHMIDSFAEWCR